MGIYQWLKRWLIASAIVYLSACGGLSVSGTDGTGDGSIQVTSIGTIERFGSIVVNGIRYDTSNALFTLDNETGGQADLFAGQVIVLQGSINADGKTGIANTVVFNTTILGPISEVDPLEPKFTILGQTIWVDESTRFDGVALFAQLQVGQTSRISGFFNAEGQLVATHVAVLNQTVESELTGVIQQLDTNAQTLRINDLTVDYATISGTAAILQNGQVIHIKGSLNAERVFIASAIESAALQLGTIGQTVELEGLITGIDDQQHFSVNGVPIVTSSNTVFENGSALDIGLNARIEVEGSLNSDNALVAEKIIIIHTAPQVFSGQLNKNEKRIYEIKTSDEDKAIWVRLTGLSHQMQMFVSKNRQVTTLAECIRWKVVGDDGFCYLENDAPTTWYITLGANSDAIDYQLSVFLRRAVFSNTVELIPGESQTITTTAGDRQLFAVDASLASESAVLTVTLDGPVTNDFLYINADQPPSLNQFECSLRKDSSDLSLCRVLNRDVNQWFISLDSAIDSHYTINAEFIQPQILQSGESITAQLSEAQQHIGALYQINTRATDASVAIALTDIATDGDLSPSQINLKVHQAGANPPSGLWDCIATRRFDQTESCVLENTTDASWYILISGIPQTRYTVHALAQRVRPESIDVQFGEQFYVEQDAGVQAVYRLPPVSPNSVLFAQISDASTDFSLYIDNTPDLRAKVYRNSRDCTVIFNGAKHKVCRKAYDGSVQPNYVQIQSAFSGDYTLLIDEQPLKPLVANMPIIDSITTESIDSGVLYRFTVPEAVTSFSVKLDQQDAPVSLALRPAMPPTSQSAYCRSKRSDDSGGLCHVPNRKNTLWYVLVKGEQPSTYRLQTIWSLSD